MPNPWYQDFFRGLVVDLWHQFPTPELTASEATSIASLLHLQPAARVLDAPCGDGRHAHFLATRGFHLTGLDISPEFLAHARNRDPDNRVSWLLADMLHLPPGPFDAIYCYGNSFGYLDHPDTIRFLHAVCASLAPGGRFLLEAATVAETLLPTLQPLTDITVGDIQMRVERHYDYTQSRLASTYSFTRDGHTETRNMTQAVYTSGEICRLLAAAGLTVEHLYGDLDGSPFSASARRLILVARRP